MLVLIALAVAFRWAANQGIHAAANDRAEKSATVSSGPSSSTGGEKVKLPPGYAALWSGQHEAMARVRDRLTYIIPLTLFLVFLLLYFNTRSLTKTAIVALAVPFSAIGAVRYLYVLGYNMSIAVWVGLIALMGVDAETGVFMLLYLDLSS